MPINNWVWRCEICDAEFRHEVARDVLDQHACGHMGTDPYLELKLERGGIFVEVKIDATPNQNVKQSEFTLRTLLSKVSCEAQLALEGREVAELALERILRYCREVDL